MKYFLFLIFISYISMNPSENDCIRKLFLKTQKGDNKLEKHSSTDEFGVRQTIDSLNYSIIRRWKADMTPIIESINNNSENIDSWKEYHDNGKIKEIGFKTSSINTKIGVWKYFSSSGKIDSIVDYDKNYKIPFCEFYELASKRKFVSATSQIRFDSESRKWIIEKWDYQKDAPTGRVLEIQVDSKKIIEYELYGKN